jgi:hypothetical protein
MCPRGMLAMSHPAVSSIERSGPIGDDQAQAIRCRGFDPVALELGSQPDHRPVAAEQLTGIGQAAYEAQIIDLTHGIRRRSRLFNVDVNTRLPGVEPFGGMGVRPRWVMCDAVTVVNPSVGKRDHRLIVETATAWCANPPRQQV